LKFLRALLVLGRVSNLPTVWSNCLAGWLLGGGGHYNRLPFLFGGATLLYVGGMFLNDAFDANFDREHRKERPIPSGAISVGAVGRWSVGWLLAGLACLFWLGSRTGVAGLILLVCIVIYDWIHKRTILAPVLMGACRMLLYLVTA
jgi:4-hydroxybenzoate polyprenyltransferase